MCDESTDISIFKQVVMYAQFVNESGNTQSAFLQIKDLFNGTAETIEAALVKYCEERETSWRSRPIACGPAMSLQRGEGLVILTEQVASLLYNVLHRARLYLDGKAAFNLSNKLSDILE